MEDGVAGSGAAMCAQKDLVGSVSAVVVLVVEVEVVVTIALLADHTGQVVMVVVVVVVLLLPRAVEEQVPVSRHRWKGRGRVEDDIAVLGRKSRRHSE